MNKTEFLDSVKDFYEKRKGGDAGAWAYCFTPGLQPTYWASSYPALVYSLTGLLDSLSFEDKTEWLE
ncbi:MAG: hypothetical protein R3232_11580, partial [Clostridia bacterium]|nr:hypothetical protein [Clostridia bacterium]